MKQIIKLLERLSLLFQTGIRIMILFLELQIQYTFQQKERNKKEYGHSPSQYGHLNINLILKSYLGNVLRGIGIALKSQNL